MPSVAIGPDRPVPTALDPTGNVGGTVLGCPGRVLTITGALSSLSRLRSLRRLSSPAKSLMHALSTCRIGILSCITA